jgi:hypothetical protein
MLKSASIAASAPMFVLPVRCKRLNKISCPADYQLAMRRSAWMTPGTGFIGGEVWKSGLTSMLPRITFCLAVDPFISL